MITNIKQRKSDNQGFTIIETMIVLAIAGLILLIVFLAVPALQRSARNTQRKNDVSAIGAALSNYIDNNGGQFPDTVQKAGSSRSVEFLCTKGTTHCDSTDKNIESAKLGYYDPGLSTLPVSMEYQQGPGAGTQPTTETVVVDTGEECNPTGTGVAAKARSRSVAILYQTETGGSPANQCIND
ncbi:MAG: type II secretion system protein [Candidatus Saccharimonadales bacterium]